MHQTSRVASWGTVPLDILIISFAIICDIQAWYHLADTDSLLNILEVVVPFCMELAMAMTLLWVTCALSNCIATTALAIFTSTSSENNEGVPRIDRGVFTVL